MKQDKTIENAQTDKVEPKKARRELLSGGAMAAASVMFGFVAAACSDDSDGPSNTGVDGGKPDSGLGGSIDGGLDATTPPPADSGAGTGTDKDIAQLNALLSAEYNAITAYTAGAGLIGKAPNTDPLFPLAGPITQIAVSIQSQHKLHAAALVDAIGSLNGTPVVEADVAAKFVPPAKLVANPTIANVLKFAAGAEKGAAVSYNTVLANMEAAKFRFLASVIEGDETQHFIVLAALVLGLADPGPNLAANTGKVVPEPFVHSFGSNPGLDQSPPNYFT